MKPADSSGRRGSDKSSAAPATDVAAKPGPAAKAPLSRRRRWLFRLLALTLAPALFLVLVEAGFRLAGYGHPVSFFVPATIQGQRVLVENDKFGWRFFPPELARSAAPTVLQPAKPPGTYRIFLFGESAALGDPRPAYGMGRYLQVLLQERFPKTRFEVVPVAMTAINSHAFPLIARECASLGGDLWIVYAGHNEMVGPFGATKVFGAPAPPAWVVRAALALKATRTGQWLSSLARRWSHAESGGGEWAGMKMFRESQVAPDDPKRAAVHRNFAANLERLVDIGLDSGAKVLLCTTTANLRDCPPFASLHGARWSPASGADWTNRFEAATALQATGNAALANRIFTELAAQDDRRADVQFQLARLAESGGDSSTARRHYEAARDQDALPFRADSDLNATVTRLASLNQTRGVGYLDTFPLLAAAATNGIPGRESFFEHVHFTPPGNYRIALGLAAQVEAVLPAAAKADARPAWADAATCDRWLALTDWNRASILTTVLQRLSDEPFTNQLDHAARIHDLARQLQALRASMRSSNAVVEAQQIYQEALQRTPADFRLHENYAEFLETIGQPKAALAEWQKLQELTPHHLRGSFNVGRMQRRLGQNAEAEKSFRETLRLRPDLTEARLELAGALAAQGRLDDAVAECRAAQRLRPGDARTQLQLAQHLAAQKHRPEAIAALREAIRLNPAYWEARYYLGVELAMDEDYAAAEKEFVEVTRLQPQFALAHLNLGVALAKQKRFAEAAVQFQETLRLEPQNASARQQLQLIKSLQPPPPGTGTP